MVQTIAIFGSTGLSGLATTEAALNKGYNVKVLVRDPSRLPDDIRSRLELIQGNVSNYADVYSTVKNSNAVIVTLGTRSDLKPTTELSEGLKNIVKAMQELKVDTVSVCLSAFLFFDDNSGRIPERMKDITAEHQRMYDILKDSGLRYVAVFAPHISEEPASGVLVENDKYISRRVSKYDLGQFLVDSLEKSEHHGKIVGIASKS